MLCLMKEGKHYNKKYEIFEIFLDNYMVFFFFT